MMLLFSENFPERNDFMQKTNHAEKIKTGLWLLLIYTCSVIVRYLLALATRNFPTVRIDEFLYYSIGRSIATEGTLLYLGQPAIYNYIVYPLILSPVYLLFGHGTDYFRVIQLWNIILMSLSVFPIYGLCKAMVQSRKTALWLSGLFMLLPCFILGEFIYSEAIIYPLFFTLMYCIYRYLTDKRIRYTIWIGILGAVLYYTKPGAVLPAILALLLFAVKAARGKSGKTGIQVLAGAACLTAGFFILKLIAENVLGYHGTLLSFYDDQASLTAKYEDSFFFYAAVRYPYYYILLGGVLPFVVTLWSFSEYSREDKQFYLLLIVCSLVTMIGSAWLINRPEQKTMLYLRYVEMYMPVLLVYIVMPKKNALPASSRSYKISDIVCYVILVYVVVCTAVWGSTTGIGEPHESHFLISLSALLTRNVMGIANILILLLAGLAIYLTARKAEKQTVIRICCILGAGLVLIHNIQGYVTTGNNTSQAFAEETKVIHQRIGDQEFVHVYAENQCDYGLDINSRKNLCRITEEDFINNIRDNHGVYVPFVPSSVQGMKAEYSTPDIDMLVFDKDVYKHIQFSDRTYGFISDNNNFRIVQFNRGDRIVDSSLFYDQYLTYTLTVYKEEWLSRPIKIRLEMESETEQELGIIADQQYTVQMSEGDFWYEIEITEPIGEYTFTVQDSSVKLNNYEVISIE